MFNASRSGGHWPILLPPNRIDPLAVFFCSPFVLDEYSNKIRSERHLTEVKGKGKKVGKK